MKKLSVIIPVYNVEAYVKKSVESVLSQTYKNIEIIIINDGSTDRSYEICKELEKNHDNIRLYSQENKGLAETRNIGMELSTGDYIAFLDSDDYVESEMYETLIKVIESKDVAFASCLTKPSNLETINSNGTIETLDRTEIIESLRKDNRVRFEVWNKVFRKDALNHVRFRKRSVYEDIEFMNLLLVKEIKTGHINLPMHNYTKHRLGNTNSSFKLIKLDALDRILEFIQNPINNERDIINLQVIYQEFIFSLFLQAKKFKSKEAVKKLIKDFDMNYKYFINNKYTNKVKIRVFRFSSNLYYQISKLKEKNNIY